MQIVSIGDNLHEISNPVFWKYKKNIKLASAELAKVETTSCGEREVYILPAPKCTEAASDTCIRNSL